jgi:hypothetical protein
MNRRLEFRTDGKYVVGVLKTYAQTCSVSFSGETIFLEKQWVDMVIEQNAQELEGEAHRIGLWQYTMPYEQCPGDRLVFASQNKQRIYASDFSHGFHLRLSGMNEPRLLIFYDSIPNYKKLEHWVDLRRIVDRFGSADSIVVTPVGSKFFPDFKKEYLLLRKTDLGKQPDGHEVERLKANYTLGDSLYLGDVCLWTRTGKRKKGAAAGRKYARRDDTESDDESIEEFDEDYVPVEDVDSTDSEAETEPDTSQLDLCSTRITALCRGRMARRRVLALRARLALYVLVD